MIRKFKELTLGKVVVQERTYTGFVEFEVVSVTPDLVSLKSISTYGYNLDLTPEQLNQYNQAKKYWFESVDEARTHTNNVDTKLENEIVKAYTADKEAFIAQMIGLAYHSKTDPEYGDYVHATAIKKAAAVLFPDLKLI